MTRRRIGWILLPLFASGLALADPPHSKGGGHDKDRDGGSDVVVSFSFGGSERVYVQDYYRHNLPPGLAKKGKIPPGHAKRMSRGMAWPPGVAYDPLPLSLQRQLSPLPRGYARFIVGEDVVIVDMNARLIVDVVNLLF